MEPEPESTDSLVRAHISSLCASFQHPISDAAPLQASTLLSKSDTLKGHVLFLSDTHASLVQEVLPALTHAATVARSHFEKIDALEAYLAAVDASVAALERDVDAVEVAYPSTMKRLLGVFGSSKAKSEPALARTDIELPKPESLGWYASQKSS